MKANEQLKAWLAGHKVQQSQMAARCNYDRGNFNRLLGGTLKPSLTLAAAIERETDGVVKAVDWVEK